MSRTVSKGGRNVLVLLSGFPCPRNPWGESGDVGTVKHYTFSQFLDASQYLKLLFKGINTSYICVTWDNIGRDMIESTYKPIKYHSYSQGEFLSNASRALSALETKRKSKRDEYYSGVGGPNGNIVSSIRYASQLQSRTFAARLALEHLESDGCSYDAILLTRYDITTRGGHHVRHPVRLGGSDFDFLDSELHARFLLPTFNQLNCGYPDMWFYMNYAGLKYYSGITESYIKDLLDEDSEYRRLMTKGWPHSETFNLSDEYDYRQYSNVVLNPRPTDNFMSYPDWEVPNLHCYHKYYLSLSPYALDGVCLRWIGSTSVMLNSLRLYGVKLFGARFLKEFVNMIIFQLRVLIRRFCIRSATN